MTRFISIVILLSTICSAVFTEETEKTTVLDLSAFMQLVCRHGTFKEFLIQELSLKYNRILGTPQIQLILDTTAHYTIALDSAEGSHLAGSVTLSSLFPASGTEVSAEYDTGRSVSGTVQNSSVSLKVEQAVLNNAFGTTNRLKELMAGNENELARYQILEAYEDYLTEVIALYIEWYAAYQNILYAEKSLEQSRTLLNLTRQKRQYNIALPIDVNKSTLQVLTAEEQLNKAENAYEILRKEVAMLTGFTSNEFSSIPGDPVLSEYNIEIDNEIDAFMLQSRTVKMLDLLTTMSRQELDIALDQLLPTAKVYAAYNISGIEYLPLENQSNDLELGFSVSVPLLNTGANADVELKKNLLEASILSQSNQKENLNLQLTTLRDTIAFLNKQLELAEQKLSTARLIVRDEEIRYNQGRSGLDDVLKAYETLDSINQSRISIMVQLHKSYIEWLRFTDTLIDENKQIILEKDLPKNNP
ncbi:MAG: TolC family protein [Spirochaetales bacterium]|nr:TolC family protein [Spirochaetales bacterium]